MLIFVCQTFEKQLLTLDFYANQSFVSKNLCENRNKPQLHCNGKCQLQKKLNQAANNDKQNPERKVESSNEVLFCKNSFPQVAIPFLISIQKEYFTPDTKAIVDQSFEFFHPPKPFFI